MTYKELKQICDDRGGSIDVVVVSDKDGLVSCFFDKKIGDALTINIIDNKDCDGFSNYLITNENVNDDEYYVEIDEQSDFQPINNQSYNDYKEKLKDNPDKKQTYIEFLEEAYKTLVKITDQYEKDWLKNMYEGDK